ncbi:hypothetical protein CHLNCDRAFT_27430, partial [Chlorella variabilis]
MFNLTRTETLAIDPQQRLLLEESHACLMDGRPATGSLFGTETGVYVGCMYQEYTDVLSSAGTKLSAAAATGNSRSFMVGRISYIFGLAGPCLSTDTACSSSLVATHLAHYSLLNQETVAATAAGVNAMLSPTTTVGICQLQALSSTGRCKSFDSTGDGYGRAEGFGVVLLAPPHPGQLAVAAVRGSAMNQDGQSSGLTAPNGPSQTKLLLTSLRRGGLNSMKLRFIAVHGTGT